MTFPEYQPPVQEIRAADEGGLWLRREEDQRNDYRWLILDRQGRPRGELQWSGSRRVMWSREDVFWAAERDELGFDWLVRYRIREQPNPG